MPTANDLFVDTSGWAYYLDRQDPFHPEIVALVQRTLTQRRHLVTTNYIILELVALLSSRYHLPRQQVITAINAIKADAAVEMAYIEQALDNEAWALLEIRLDKRGKPATLVVRNVSMMTRAGCAILLERLDMFLWNRHVHG